MNTTSYMDKQIMDLSSSSPQTKDFMDLMSHNNYHNRPHQDHAVVDDDDEDQTTVVHGGATNGLSNKDEILASYDFQPIRPVAGLSATAAGSGGSSSSQSQSFDLGGSARVWNSGDSKPKTTAPLTRNYGSLDSIEPAKFVREEEHQSSFDSAIIAEIDKTMKKHSDTLMHALDGVSARLTQLETRTRQLESSVDDLKVSVGNNHGTSDGKMRQLENILREVQSGVQGIKDKQDIVESQLQLTKLQLSKQVDHHHHQETQTHHVATPVDSVLTSAASAPQQPHQNPPTSVNLPPPQPPFPVNLPPPPQLPAQFPQTQIPQRDPYFPGPTQPQEPPTQQYQIPPPHQQFQPTPQPQQFSQPPPPPPPINPAQIQPQLSHHHSEDVPPQTYPPPPPPSHRQPQTGPHQYYGGGPPPPPPNVYDQPPPPSSRPVPGHSFGYGPPPPPQPTGLNDPYHYGGSPSQYSMKPQQISSPTASQGGGGGGYPQLPTARVLPHAVPTAGPGGGGSGGGGSSGSGNRVPVDDVIDKVTTMGFSRDLVRATVRKLTENGQSVDLNIVLDKLMNDGDGQPPRGWFGR